MFEHDLDTRPRCACGKLTTFKYHKGFGVACSTKCQHVYWRETGQIAAIRDKATHTTRERYGSENAFSSETVKQKVRQSNQDRWGVSYPGQSLEIRSKIRVTNIERYGRPEGRINSSEVREAWMRKGFSRLETLTGSRISIISQQVSAVKDCYPFAHPDILFRCNECGSEDVCNYMTMLNRIALAGTACASCSGITDKSSSIGQRAVAEFLRQQGFRVIENDRTILAPKHLDIVLPDKNIAIEYNGIFFHSERRRPDPDYHLDKLAGALRAGYKLITIFEDEWIYRRSAVEARLLHLLGRTESRYFARDCTLVEIAASTAREFVETFHVQGYTGSRFRYGLMKDGCLIAVMTFSLPSIAKGAKTKESQIEISRYCTNGSVVGGASRLLKRFCKDHPEYKTIFSFADRRWGEGTLYLKIGFSFEYFTRPNYWYVDGRRRLHRFGQRKRASDISELTEWQNRLRQGLYRIWDCGSVKYSYQNPFSIDK